MTPLHMHNLYEVIHWAKSSTISIVPFMFKHLRVSIALLLLGATTTLISCEKDAADPVTKASSSISDAISVDEAKAWAAQHLLTTQLSTAQAVSKANDYRGTEPIWDQAVIHRFANGQLYVRVPLRYKAQLTRGFIASGLNAVPFALPDPQLIIFKNANGETEAQVREFRPTEDYVKKHPAGINGADFSGRIYNLTWAGEFVKGTVYENGQPTKRLMAVNHAQQPGTTDQNKWEYTTYVVYEQYSDCMPGTNSPNYGQFQRIQRQVITRDGDPEPSGQPYYLNYQCDAWETGSTWTYQQATWVPDEPGDPVDPNTTPIMSGHSYHIGAAHNTDAYRVLVAYQGNPGEHIVQYTFGSGTVNFLNSRWIIQLGTDGYYTIKHEVSGNYADAAAGSTANGTRVVLWPSVQNLRQRWIITPTSNDYFKITSALDSSVGFDIENAAASDGAELQLWSHGGGSNQQWFLTQIQ